MLKQRISPKVYNLMILMRSFMFNRYIVSLQLSFLFTIIMIPRIFNGIKFYCKFTLDDGFSWQYIITLLLTGISALTLILLIYKLLRLLINHTFENYLDFKDHYSYIISKHNKIGKVS